MKNKKSFWLSLSAAAGFLAVGIPYWRMPYGEISLPDALLTPALTVVLLSALLLRAYRIAPFRDTVLVTGLSVGAAVLGRVVFEAVQDSTSHNLWPFEIVIALIVGFICAAAGAVVGNFVGRYLPDRSS